MVSKGARSRKGRALNRGVSLLTTTLTARQSGNAAEPAVYLLRSVCHLDRQALIQRRELGTHPPNPLLSRLLETMFRHTSISFLADLYHPLFGSTESNLRGGGGQRLHVS